MLACLLTLSSSLYEAGVPFNKISLILAAASAVNYLLFDGTKQGLTLAVLSALAAPAFELVLMHYFGVWHYPQGNLPASLDGHGIPSWVPWCYFFYTPSIGSLSRYLWNELML